MSKIVKNTTLSTYTVTDTGVSIPAEDQYTIPSQDYWKWAASSDVITGIGNEDLVINDGSNDLSISDGTDLIKHSYPKDFQLRGYSGSHLVDVNLINGIRKMETNASVTVEQLLGLDPFPDTWFEVTNAGNTNDTVRVQIAATTNDPSTPDRDAPAVDKTITVTASEAGDEMALRNKIITELNGDTNFSSSLKAIKIPNIAVVHITSKFRGDFWERPNSNDFQVTPSGSVAVTLGYDNISIRGKQTALSRDPNYGHKLGTLGISGTVNVLPGAIGRRYEEFLCNDTNWDLRVNGSTTPVYFTAPLSTTEDIYIQQIRIFGGGRGIKYGQFLSRAALTNGIEVTIKSDDETFEFPKTFKVTEDLKNIFSAPNVSAFHIDVQSGSDQCIAIFENITAFPLRKTGTFGAGNDDFIKIKIQDDLSSGLSQLQAIASGFKVES